MDLDAARFQDVDDTHADIRRELIDETGDEQVYPCRQFAGVSVVHDLFSIKRVGEDSALRPLLKSGTCYGALTFELACPGLRRQCHTARRDN